MTLPGIALIFVVLFSVSIRLAGAANEGPVAAGADAAAVKASAAAENSKHYTLYMGSDVVVRIDGVLCPVRGVRGSNWIVDFKGEVRLIPTRQTATQIKVVPSLKLAQRTATIEGLKTERDYSFNNDPGVRLTRSLDEVASMNADLISVSRDAQARVDTFDNKALGAAAALVGSDDQFSQTAVQGDNETLPIHFIPASGQFVQASNSQYDQTLSYQLNYEKGQAATLAHYQEGAEAAADDTDNGDEPGSKLMRTGLDAIDVEFEISSPVPVRSPYVVTVAQFHLKGGKPGMVQNLVYARELHEIDIRPTHVAFVETGYPYDFQLMSFQLHVYNNGQEIPTSISQKRVDLDSEDAFEYMKLDYTGSHKEATLSAVPVMATLPPDLHARLAAGKYQGPLFVAVSKDGLGGGAFSDASCRNRIDDPYVQAVVRGIRFMPALSGGKPVDGVTPIDLQRLNF